MSRYPNSELPASTPSSRNDSSTNERTEAGEMQQQLSMINQAVTRYLAQREHGFKELIHKLVQKGFTEKWVEQVVQEFANRDWQSDQRFASAMIKRRIEKGYGQRFIAAECQSKGLDSSLVNGLLNESDTDWYQVAYQCAQRKFGGRTATDQKAQMKQYRFLVQRGFSSDIVRAVLDDLHRPQQQ